MMNLKTTLLDHQRAAVEKTLPVRIGALFMEMGTGKCRTAIELAARRVDKIDRIIWFCPVSLKETVRQEILKHTDCVESDIHVFDDKTSERTAPACLWYVAGVESMSASNRVVLAVNRLVTERCMVIVDESSYIKGHGSVRTRRITSIGRKARYRLILTGTPISQGVVDLFAQMRFLSPKILGYDSFYAFAANHLEYSDKYPGMIVRSHNTEYIAAKIAPYVYQVTKDQCLDLPGKLYETRHFSMTDGQRAFYEKAKDEILLKIDRDDFDSITIFRLFTALQSIVCGFWNRRGGSGNVERIEMPHRRTDTLLATVAEIPLGEKVIIWCKYKHDIMEIGKALRNEFGEGAAALFYGGLDERQKNAEVARFRESARFFLSTQSCGGHGLTLNEARHVIFYSNAFKFSERLQAEDRCHRIGQTRRAVYVDIQCMNSIDDRIAKSLAAKGDAVQEFKDEVEKVKSRKERMKRLVKGL